MIREEDVKRIAREIVKEELAKCKTEQKETVKAAKTPKKEDKE